MEKLWIWQTSKEIELVNLSKLKNAAEKDLYTPFSGPADMNAALFGLECREKA